MRANEKRRGKSRMKGENSYCLSKLYVQWDGLDGILYSYLVELNLPNGTQVGCFMVLEM